MLPMHEAGSRFGASMDRLPEGGETTDLTAEVAAARSAIADVRQAVLQTQSQLARIGPFGQKLAGTEMNPDRLLADAREQARGMLAYMDDAERFADALEGRDPGAVEAAAVKLVRGGFLLLDNQVLLYRGRQALFPPSRSAHQLVAVTIQLYRAMSVAGNSWYEAQQGAAEIAARGQRTKFVALADELEAALRQGRANLARESAGLAAGKPRGSADPSLVRIHAAAESLQAVAREQFAIGDDLLAWLRARADTPGSVLKAQSGPELITELSVFEERLLAAMEKGAAALANVGR
jgi:hypothetical protein